MDALETEAEAVVGSLSLDVDAVEYGLVNRFGWSAGPWDGEPDTVRFVRHGYRCLAWRHSSYGSWCGYLAVPVGHPVYSVRPEDIAIDCHGGITFTSESSKLLARFNGRSRDLFGTGQDSSDYWIGFDCGHGGDAQPGFGRMGWTDSRDVYRDLNYVMAQLENMAFQAREMCI